MKKKFTLVKTVACVLGVALCTPSNAQNIGNLLKGGKDDVQKIMDAYMSPGLNAMAAGLNSGWYNSAKTKKLFRVDLRIGTALIMAPSAEQTFDVTKLGLTLLRPADPAKTIAPTLLGSSSDTPPTLNIWSPAVTTNGVVTAPSTKISSIELAKGLSSGLMLTPQAQLNIGFGKYLKNTDISIRLIPQMTLSDAYIGMWGIGIRHDLYQWIPALQKVRLFDLALALGYTRMSFGYKNIGAKPATGSVAATDADVSNFDNQNVETTLSAFNAEVLISRKLLFLTPYCSVGYGYSSSNLALKGDYAIPNGPKTNASGLPINAAGTVEGDITKAQQTYTVWKDPFSISSSKSNVYATVGFQLNILWVLRLYASYTLGSLYNSANVGGGVGFDF